MATVQTVVVPELGGSVGIRSLSAADRLTHRAGTTGDVWVCVRGLVDATGEPLFSTHDTDALGEKAGGWIARVADRIKAISGLGPNARPAARAALEADEERQFAIRLSLVYRQPVGRLLDSMTGEEFVELMAYETLHGPLPDTRPDYLAAGIRHAIYDVERDRRKHPQSAPVEDFLLKWHAPKGEKPEVFDEGMLNEPTPEEPWQQIKRQMMSGWGGVVMPEEEYNALMAAKLAADAVAAVPRGAPLKPTTESTPSVQP